MDRTKGKGQDQKEKCGMGKMRLSGVVTAGLAKEKVEDIGVSWAARAKDTLGSGSGAVLRAR